MDSPRGFSGRTRRKPETAVETAKSVSVTAVADTRDAIRAVGKMVAPQNMAAYRDTHSLTQPVQQVAIGAIDATIAVATVPFNVAKGASQVAHTTLTSAAEITGDIGHAVGFGPASHGLEGAGRVAATEKLPDDLDDDSFRISVEEWRVKAEAQEVEDESTRNNVFAMLCVLEVMANFDAGVLPVTISHIMAEFGLHYSEAGILGALVYLGLVVGAPFSGYLLTSWDSQRKLLLIACVLNSLSVLMMALADSPLTLFISRALIGLTQAPLIIYCPVWVDEFAPKDKQTMWMSALQANVAGGIMVGYVAAGLVVNYWGEEICPANHHDVTNGGHDGCYNPNWRYPLFVQSFSIGLFAIYFTWVRGRFINAKGGREERIVHATKTIAQHEFRKYSDGNEYLQDHDMFFNNRENSKYEGARGVRKWLGNAYRRNSAKKKKEAQDADADADAEQPTLEHHQHRRQSVVLESTDVIGQKGLGESLGILDMFGDHDEDENATDSVADSHFVKQLALLLKCKLYVCVTMSLTGLYFVVTGIQFWVTDYLTLPIAEGGMGEDLGTVVIGFSICSLTGPTAGVFLGGWVVDRMGGYQDVDGSGEQPMIALKACVWFATGCLLFTIPTALATNYYLALASMWFLLLFGGAIVSPATGVMINAVHQDLRSWSAAMSLFVYNILGYAAAPFTCGMLAQYFGLAVGFRVVVIGGGMYTYLALMLAYLQARAQYEAHLEANDDGTGDLKVFNPMMYLDMSPRDMISPRAIKIVQPMQEGAGLLDSAENEEEYQVVDQPTPDTGTFEELLDLAVPRSEPEGSE